MHTMKKTILIINREKGTIEFLTPPPAPLRIEQLHKERYSEIVPTNPVKRWVFRFLRWVFGEEGRVSEWTRRWRCLWTAEILIGEHKGERFTHLMRAKCVEWEHNKFAERTVKK